MRFQTKLIYDERRDSVEQQKKLEEITHKSHSSRVHRLTHPLMAIMDIEGREQFEDQSPLFDVALHDSDIFGTPAGPTKAVSGGWWVLSKPLST